MGLADSAFVVENISECGGARSRYCAGATSLASAGGLGRQLFQGQRLSADLGPARPGVPSEFRHISETQAELERSWAQLGGSWVYLGVVRCSCAG